MLQKNTYRKHYAKVGNNNLAIRVFSVTCTPGHTLCDVSNCILDEWICDGNMDCSDGTDEEGCPGMQII